MANVTITSKMAIESMEEAIERRGGGTVVEVCNYVHGHNSEARPGCLVGEALFLLGVPMNVLASIDAIGNGDNAQPTAIGLPHVQDVLEKAGFSLTPMAAEVYSKAQVQQDSYNSWWDSINHAISYREDLIESYERDTASHD